MQCPWCGGARTMVSLVKSDIICTECGMPIHIDGHYFYNYSDYF